MIRAACVGAIVAFIPTAFLGYLSVFGFWNGAAAPTTWDYVGTELAIGLAGAIVGGAVGAAWGYLTTRRMS